MLPSLRSRLGALAGLVVVTVVACARSPRASESIPPAAPASAAAGPSTPATATEGTSGRGLDRANMDTTCAACNDFYHYANGGWIKRTPVPAAFTRWGSFDALLEQNNVVVRRVLDDAAAKASAGTAEGTAAKLGTFYATCMDSARAEADGAEPLDSDLARIAAIRTRQEMQAEIARLHERGVNALFGFGSTQDYKNTSQVIAGAAQGGLGLPDRDYYTTPDQRSQQIRDEYVAHVGRTFRLLGESEAQAQADARTVMNIETALAKASLTLVQRRDPNLVYNKKSIAEAQALTPNFDWASYLRAIGAPAVRSIIFDAPDFFRTMNGMLVAVPLANWKTYLRWHLAESAAPYLSTAWVEEDFRFNQAVLRGAKEQQPRWRRCATAADLLMGEALGAAYVARAFTPEDKSRALAIVTNLRAALRDRIASLEWMTASTRTQALVKLDAFAQKIGYPERWRDYSALEVAPGSFQPNVVRAVQFAVRRDLAKIGKPVDRTEWGMTPPTVNAYYNPLMNEIVFPAGILQPPFFNPAADDAVNYGAMGVVIGHEMTHGFDDQGRQFDAQGNLRDWWSPEDAKAYTARASLVSKQFDAYTVLDSVHVNGKLTLGENIADLGGLKIAYAAYQKSLAGKPRPANVGGFTPEQRFFLGYAQIWRQNIRDEAQRLRINTDPHSPAKWRVNGPLSNMPEFARAFGCKAGDAMMRAESLRAQIW